MDFIHGDFSILMDFKIMYAKLFAINMFLPIFKSIYFKDELVIKP